MIENATLAARRGSTWQLLAEFILDKEAGSEQQAVEQVAAAVQEVGLQPVQVERIRQAMREAVCRAERQGKEAQPNLRVHICIWSSGGYAKGCGWGFFLVESQAHGGPTVETEQVIELFLYQE